MLPALIYCVAPPSSRLRYVLDWIFVDQFNMQYRLTLDRGEWEAYQGVKLNYSQEDLSGGLRIIPSQLLFETEIHEQQLAIQRWKKTTVLFYNQPRQPIPFDLFAATFYLISRYEEYLPHKKDKHNRFDARGSDAFVYGFLEEPIVDEWLMQFKMLLSNTFACEIHSRKFAARMTFDVDMAWKYLNKGTVKTMGGFCKDVLTFRWKGVFERALVLSRRKEDPYFSFPLLEELHEKYRTDVVYFVLLGSGGTFDKNTSPGHPAMKMLVQHLDKQGQCGIHPSYRSHEDEAELRKELLRLESILQKQIQISRQHFIKFSLPDTYRALIKIGIRDDFSMGYATMNGFRAGTSNSFFWYDLMAEQQTELRVHSFAFMDATSKFYLHQDSAEAYTNWSRLYRKIERVDGTFISIWHNFILSGKSDRKSWLPTYEKILDTYFGDTLSPSIF